MLYNEGDGNDTIKGFGASHTLIIGNDTYSTTKSENDLLVKVGAGSILIKDYDTPTIKSKLAETSATNTVEKSTATADTVKSQDTVASQNTVSSGDSQSTINGSEGTNNVINNFKTGDNVLINYGNINYGTINYGNASTSGNSATVTDTVAPVTVPGNSSKDTVTTSTTADSSVKNTDTVAPATVPGNSSKDTVTTGSKDTVVNDSGITTIDGWEGYDNIQNRGLFDVGTDNAFINAGAGDDRISNGGNNVTIRAGAGNDTIDNGSSILGRNNRGTNVLITGGEGDDTITNSGSNVTISGGKGNDYIPEWNNCSVSSFYRYYAGDGNDTISTGYSNHSTLEIVGSSYTTVNSDKNGLIVNVGEGSIALPSFYSSPIMIQGTYGNAPVENVPATTATETPSTAENSIGIGDNNIINGNVVINNYYDNSTTNNYITNNVFSYKGGNDTLTNFNSNDKLNFGANYTGHDFADKDVVIYASEGSLGITQARNKLVGIADGNGNLMANAFFAESYEGEMDGRSYGVFEVIQGSDDLSNQIYAGEKGSSLYGGFGADDNLYGNVGSDEFVYKYGDGNDNFYNIGSEDVVNLNSMNLEQVSSAEITEGGVIAKFNDGGALTVHGLAGTFIVNGQRFGADFKNKTWHAKSI